MRCQCTGALERFWTKGKSYGGQWIWELVQRKMNLGIGTTKNEFGNWYNEKWTLELVQQKMDLGIGTTKNLFGIGTTKN